MNSKPKTTALCLAALLAVAAVGCQQATQHVEVYGELTLDGDPIDLAQVYLSPKSVASAKDSPGTFTATVEGGQFAIPKEHGPPPGEYEVIVQPVEPDPEEMLARIGEKNIPELQACNQLRNAVARKGPIRVELLPDEVNEVSIELTTR